MTIPSTHTLAHTHTHAHTHMHTHTHSRTHAHAHAHTSSTPSPSTSPAPGWSWTPSPPPFEQPPPPCRPNLRHRLRRRRRRRRPHFRTDPLHRRHASDPARSLPARLSSAGPVPFFPVSGPKDTFGPAAGGRWPAPRGMPPTDASSSCGLERGGSPAARMPCARRTRALQSR
jgi:hypothetical protein